MALLNIKIFMLYLIFGEGGTFAPGQGTLMAPADCDDWQVTASWDDGDPAVFCHGSRTAELVPWQVNLYQVGYQGEILDFSHHDDAIHVNHLSRHGMYEVYVRRQ